MNVELDSHPRQDEAGSETPAPSVFPPASALGLLLSRALSSGRAPALYRKGLDEARPHRDPRKAKNLGGLGAKPPSENRHSPDAPWHREHLHKKNAASVSKSLTRSAGAKAEGRAQGSVGA